MVQEPGLEDLFVEPGAVEARVVRELDVFYQVLLGGGGVDAVGVEALVQHGAQEQGLAVEQELPALKLGGAQAEVALHPVLPEGEGQIVQAALPGLPQVGLRQIQLGGEEAPGQGQGHASHLFAFPTGLGGQGAGALGLAGEGHLAVFHVGVVPGGDNVVLRHELQPHRLPDAGSAGVVAGVGVILVRLLALGLQAAAHVVLHRQEQGVLPGGHERGDVEGEGGVAPLVAAGPLAVDHQDALVVHGAEVQQHPAFYLLLSEGESPAVGHAVHKVGVADAGELALRAEGHQDLPVPGLLFPQLPLQGAAAKVKRKVPQAVEVLPAGPLPLGIGMFRARHVHKVTPLFCKLWSVSPRKTQTMRLYPPRREM